MAFFKICISEHVRFNKVLLRPDDRPWSADPYPGNDLCSSHAVMFHHVASNQSASPPQASLKEKDKIHEKYTEIQILIYMFFQNKAQHFNQSHLTFAVDSNGSLCVLTNVEELPDDRIIWCTPVHKEQIVMFKSRLSEASGIVHLFVESDDGCDVVLPEVRDVGLGSVQRVP